MGTTSEAELPVSHHSPERGPEARRVRRSLRDDVWNIPNLLTYARVAMIPLVLWLLDRGTKRDAIFAAVVYALAAATDVVDGILARRLGVVSMIGQFLDPLADKLMVMATLVWLVPLGKIPAWAVVVLLGRELSVTGLRSIASAQGLVIAAGQGGKQKTALQVVGILCLIIGWPYELTLFGLDLGVVDMVHVGRALVYLSLVMSFTSMAEYVALFVRTVEAAERPPKPGA